ncbi:MAG: APC family permease [Alphaproteobacteria bacterium]|nr:APC family permease [Alphaproteobacteria bacterium]
MTDLDPTADGHQVRGRLLRIFGLGFGLAVVIGGTIGSGILRNPSVVAAGFVDTRLILLAWLAGGLFVAIDAMPTVELGAAIPLSGGPYSLAARSIGPFTGFFVGWADWLQLVMSTGFIAVAFGQYVQRLGIMADWSTAVVAILLLIGCGVLNWIGARVGGASQNIGSALKALVLVALVITLFVAAKPEAAAAPPPPLFTWVAAAVALRAIYGAYGGWQAAVYFSEEVHQPERNIARATFAGIALVTALYVLVNAAVLHVVPVGILVNSTLAVSDAAAMVLGPGSGTIVTILAIICVATIANLQVMEHVRTTYAMARKGMLPPGLATVSASGTPRAALVVVLVCIALVITGATFIKGGLYEVLLNLYAPNIMIIFLLLSYGALKLRRTEPDLPRPYKMPFYPLPALVSIVINGILLVLFLTTDLVTSIWSIIFLALAVPLYFLGRSRWRAA